MGIFDLPPRTLTIIAIMIGFVLIDDLTALEQNSLGNFLILVGQVLEANSAQQQVIQAKHHVSQVNELKIEIEKLKSELKKFQ